MLEYQSYFCPIVKKITSVLYNNKITKKEGYRSSHLLEVIRCVISSILLSDEMLVNDTVLFTKILAYSYKHLLGRYAYLHPKL